MDFKTITIISYKAQFRISAVYFYRAAWFAAQMHFQFER